MHTILCMHAYMYLQYSVDACKLSENMDACSKYGTFEIIVDASSKNSKRPFGWIGSIKGHILYNDEILHLDSNVFGIATTTNQCKDIQCFSVTTTCNKPTWTLKKERIKQWISLSHPLNNNESTYLSGTNDNPSNKRPPGKIWIPTGIRHDKGPSIVVVPYAIQAAKQRPMVTPSW